MSRRGGAERHPWPSVMQNHYDWPLKRLGDSITRCVISISNLGAFFLLYMSGRLEMGWLREFDF